MATKRPNKCAGSSKLASYLNNQDERIEERTILEGDNYKVERRQNGVRLQISPARVAASAAEIGQFFVVREYQNYVVCVTATADLDTDPNGKTFTEGDTEIRVAKDSQFRASLYDVTSRGGDAVGDVDGYRYTYAIAAPWGRRTALATSTTAATYGALTLSTDEEIVPPYLQVQANPNISPAKRILYAAKVKQGAILRVTEDSVSYDIVWVDITPGRMWLPVKRKIRVCVEGQSGAWFALFRPSGSFQEM